MGLLSSFRSTLGFFFSSPSSSRFCSAAERKEDGEGESCSSLPSDLLRFHETLFPCSICRKLISKETGHYAWCRRTIGRSDDLTLLIRSVNLPSFLLSYSPKHLPFLRACSVKCLNDSKRNGTRVEPLQKHKGEIWVRFCLRSSSQLNGNLHPSFLIPSPSSSFHLFLIPLPMKPSIVSCESVD
jgi:hypothetical protein